MQTMMHEVCCHIDQSTYYLMLAILNLLIHSQLLYQGSNQSLNVAGDELLVLLANCQGLQNKQRQLYVIDYFSKTKPSIICLQHAHWTPDDEPITRLM